MAWLKTKLQYAREQGLNVYITGHVPPNTSNWMPTCYYAFATLVTDYRDVIQGQFYGHMNIDHFYFPINSGDPVFLPRMRPRKKISKHEVSSQKVPSWLLDYFQNLLVHYKYMSKFEDALPFPILVRLILYAYSRSHPR